MREEIKAVHLKDGNFYDNMRIDISASHLTIDAAIRNRKTVTTSAFVNSCKLLATRLALRFSLYEILITNGILRGWFNHFREYWTKVLNGRPLFNVLDFYLLLHDYRKRQQHTTQIEWNDSEKHISNWQNPNQLYATLHNVRRMSLAPVVARPLWKRIRKKFRILEYGCSLAPYYYCYRNYFSHLNCQWTLADIPNFPFHYAKYLYKNDDKCNFITISANDFSNPLGAADNFDVIIITTVFEHLDNPLFVADYLLNRLKPGGIFVFDYILSEGKGLDHPNALKMRSDTLQLILSKTNIVHGKCRDIDESIDLCIAVKTHK